MKLQAKYQMTLIALVCFGTCAKAEVPSPVPSSTPMVKIEGLLRERGTRKPLPEVNIYCFSGESVEPLKAMSQADGTFSIEVPEGDLKWVITLSGYNRLEQKDVQLPIGVSRKRDLYLQKTSYLTYETTVYGQTEKRDDKTKSLDQAQFLTVPGANGDPVKAVQNLPGVNRGQAFTSQVIIEGSAPQDTRYNIDNQSVPLIFHFGGLTSVVIPEAIDHVDYLSSGFGPEFGQTTAGLVNLFVKDPQTDRLHGLAFVDLLNAGLMVEGPAGDKSSFLIGARQSYIGFVLGLVAKNNKDFNLTVAPDYEDLISVYKTEVTPIDTFKLVGVGSRDRLQFVLSQPVKQDPSIRGTFNDSTDFFRLIPEWTHHHSSTVISRYSLGVGKDWVRFDAGSLYLSDINTVVTTRVEVEDQVNENWKTYIGLDNNYTHSDIDFQLPVIYSQGGVSNPISSSSSRSVANGYASDALGLYWRNTVHPSESRWTLLPGIRFSYYNQTSEFYPEPRVGARYALDDGLTLRAATGLYDQAPPLQDRDPTYGNPNLKSERAVHGTLGFEKDFRAGTDTGWTLSDDLFYKYLYNLVANSTAYVTPSQPEYYNNSGYGHSYGMEVLAKYRSSSWGGWLAYTLARSTRRNSSTPESLFAYDQTHLLTAVADKELGRNWKFSTRVRYSTGNPYTPIVGSVFDADNDVYIPLRGDIYSQRVGPFFEIDIRFDKKWIYKTWILTAYLDVENVTNRSNPQQIDYSYNYQQTATVNGLPFFPTLGLKAEF